MRVFRSRNQARSALAPRLLEVLPTPAVGAGRSSAMPAPVPAGKPGRKAGDTRRMPAAMPTTPRSKGSGTPPACVFDSPHNHTPAELVDSEAALSAQADFISLHLPLTQETKGMINRHAIERMKDGAILVNTARGNLVVEEDVAAALRSGKLRAYATDVNCGDPPEHG